ncbi:MAG TPA: putative N-acetylmannosamine-6-phosphate 2-epimerase [Candidatus Tyrphobacter sp.]
MSVLDALRGQLIVSVQAPHGSALDDPQAIAAIAAAACEAGAAAVRIESVAHLKAARARLGVPIIGLIKREYAGFAPYITPTLAEVRAVLACGTEIVAFDATSRPRPDGSTVEAIVAAVGHGGALAMADCSDASDARRARDAGAEILATTLCGYTDETRGAPAPALALVRELATIGGFVVCEGGITTPASGRAALDAGAQAIVVGTAITGVAKLTRAFAAGLRDG